MIYRTLRWGEIVLLTDQFRTYSLVYGEKWNDFKEGQNSIVGEEHRPGMGHAEVRRKIKMSTKSKMIEAF